MQTKVKLNLGVYKMEAKTSVFHISCIILCFTGLNILLMLYQKLGKTEDPRHGSLKWLSCISLG